MRKDIHPKYYDAKIECACGAKYNIGATKEKMAVEICSACHPFYSGKEKLVDAAGRVEKFRMRVAAKSAKQENASKTGATKIKVRKPRGVKK